MKIFDVNFDFGKDFLKFCRIVQRQGPVSSVELNILAGIHDIFFDVSE